MNDLLRLQRTLNNYQQQQQLQNFQLGTTTTYVPLTLEETLNIINTEPDLVRSILSDPQYTEQPVPVGDAEPPVIMIGDEMIGENISPPEIMEMLNEYRFQPSEIHLQQLDYRRIKEYLGGTRKFSELTPDQATLVESLKYTTLDEFDVDANNFKFARDGARFANLREQLLGKLDGDGIMTSDTIERFGDIDTPLPETFSTDYLYPSVKGAQRPGIGGPDHVVSPDAPPVVEMQPISGKGTMWFLEEGFLDEFSHNTWTEFFDMDYHGGLTGNAMNQQLLLDSQGFDGTFDEFLNATNMTADQFKPLFDNWNRMYLDAIDAEVDDPMLDIHRAEPGEIELQELIDDEPIEEKVDSPIDDQVEPFEPFEPFEETPIRPFIDDDVSAVLNEIGNQSAVELQDMVAMSSDGAVYLNTSLYTKFVDAAPNLWVGAAMAPGISTILGLINKVLPGSSRWINIGMGALDLLTSGNPLGLAIQGIAEIVSEVGIDNERKREDDFAQSKRGSRYGYFKDENGEWKFAFLNTVVKSTSFGSREQVMTIEYGDTILWKKDKNDELYPMFQDPKEYLVQADDWQVTEEKLYNYTPWYSKEYMEKNQPTRRWFFLTPEEEAEAFSGDTYNDVIDNLQSMKPNIDESRYPKYTQNILDWQKAIILKEKLRYGDDEVTEWDPTTGLSRVTTYYPTILYGDNYEENLKSWDLPEENWLIDEYMPTLIQNLVSSQRAAAREAGYQEQFGEDENWTNYYSKGLTPPGAKMNDYWLPEDTHYADISGQRSWSANYLKFDRDLPAAKDYAELEEQINNISGYDENESTKNYLTQKAFTRYFVDQLVSRGKGDVWYQAVMQNDSLMGEDNSEYGLYAVPWANKTDQDSMIVGRDDEVVTHGLFTPYQQKGYDAWVKTRNDNELDAQTWNVNFNADEPDKTEETDKTEENDPPVDAQPDQLPYIFFKGNKIPNPDYSGPVDISAEDFVAPETVPALQDIVDQLLDLGVSVEEIKKQNITPQEMVTVATTMWPDSTNDWNTIFDTSLPDNVEDEETDWEQAIKMAEIWGKQGMSKNPDDYYHEQNDGTRPDNFEYKESDWEQALKMAEIWGKQGMSKNPDDYYHEQNDGTRPEDFEYEEDTIADWGLMDVNTGQWTVETNNLTPEAVNITAQDETPPVVQDEPSPYVQILKDLLPHATNPTFQTQIQDMIDQFSSDTPPTGDDVFNLTKDVFDYESQTSPVVQKDEQPPDDEPPKTTSEEVHLSDLHEITPFEQYMQEAHITDYKPGITAKDVSYIPVTATGESALYGDEPLERKLGLPDYITASKDPSTGIVHQSFHPSLIDPPFHSIQNSGHVIEAF